MLKQNTVYKVAFEFTINSTQKSFMLAFMPSSQIISALASTPNAERFSSLCDTSDQNYNVFHRIYFVSGKICGCSGKLDQRHRTPYGKISEQ